MLKITTSDDAQRLTLEGSLAGPWVEILVDSWRDASKRQDPHAVTLDLTDLTFVDQDGRALLASIHEQGGTLAGRGVLCTSLIDEIKRAGKRLLDCCRTRAKLLALIAATLASLASLVLLAGCSTVAADDAPATGRPAVAVGTATVVASALTDSVEVVGSLAPKFAADIKSEVSGTVTAVYVTQWVPVRAGAKLARLDTSEIDATIAAIKATAAQARVAQARAQREYERALSLKKYGLITAQNLDDASSALEAAEAATAAVGAQVRASEARLSKSFITAPMDGVVAYRGVNVGDRVENMGGNGPMFRIVDNRLLDLTVSVPSLRLAAVRVGQTLEFSIDALPARTFTGRVMFINPALDVASRAVNVVAEVPNPEGILKGGLFVKGRIVVGTRPGVLQVPRAALLNWDVNARSAHVFVFRNGQAEKRTVQTGTANGATVEIGTGLAAGERVVTRGAFALRSGDRVSADGVEGE